MISIELPGKHRTASQCSRRPQLTESVKPSSVIGVGQPSSISSEREPKGAESVTADDTISIGDPVRTDDDVLVLRGIGYRPEPQVGEAGFTANALVWIVEAGQYSSGDNKSEVTIR